MSNVEKAEKANTTILQHKRNINWTETQTLPFISERVPNNFNNFPPHTIYIEVNLLSPTELERIDYIFRSPILKSDYSILRQTQMHI
jgi:hypothetical protein